jgi:hypothetical protein
MGDYVVIYLDRRNKKSLEMVIDIEDFEKVTNFKYKLSPWWNRDTQTYYAIATQYLGIFDEKPKYKTIWLHRYILDIEDDNIIIDHVDHNSLNNRRYNLKESNKELNGKNRLGANRNTTSGERNVCWINKKGMWKVQLQINGKNKIFGDFDYEDLEAAKIFARQKRREYYGKE